MELLWLLCLFAHITINSLCLSGAIDRQLYVVPFPSLISNKGDGSIVHPFSSLQHALDHIEHDQYHHTTINLYPTYHHVDTIRFRRVHSHTRLTTMTAEDVATFEKSNNFEPAHQRLSMPTISGGIPITNWTQISGNTYSAIVPRPTFITQLFNDKQRIVRTRVPTNYSEYLQYAAKLNDSTMGRYGFQYAPGQFNYTSTSLIDAMVIVYHSWTTSHHYIDRLITSNNTIIFSNPSNYPIGKWEPEAQRRFHIENLCEALVPNSFCFVNATKTIYLMTDGSYDPRESYFVAPINEFVVVIAGEDASKPTEDIILDNIAIKHAAWDMNRVEELDRQAAAFLTYSALYIANATTITMSNIEVSHTGSYAVWIREGTTDINLVSSLITDTGAGGVRVGQIESPIVLPTSSIKVLSNEVSYGGNVFPSGVGIISHRAVDIIIADNVVHHHRYTGVSIGWQWGYATSYTSNVLVQGNYIHDTGLHVLSDQGGIYTLGPQPGTVITNNVIKNIYSYAYLVWGIYLDEGSSNLLISNNIVYNTGWSSIVQHYGANNVIINNVFARASLQPSPAPFYPPPDGDLHVELAENHTSWTFQHNIVYDPFQGPTHPVFTTPHPTVITFFDNNVYYNPYNTTLLFGAQQVPFDQWQQMNQDNNSVIADPLFLGDINQCDFFTISSNSPAAKRGFVNITKLSKWTPGCATDDTVDTSQFYRW